MSFLGAAVLFVAVSLVVQAAVMSARKRQTYRSLILAALDIPFPGQLLGERLVLATGIPRGLIYPILAGMEEDGLICSHPVEERVPALHPPMFRRVYWITERGRAKKR